MEIDLKHIEMATNGKQSGRTNMFGFLGDKVSATLLSIAAAGILGCFAFLWRLNSALATLQERDTENIRAREEMLIKINNMQLDIRDIRERLIRVESNRKQ